MTYAQNISPRESSKRYNQWTRLYDSFFNELTNAIEGNDTQDYAPQNAQGWKNNKEAIAKLNHAQEKLSEIADAFLQKDAKNQRDAKNKPSKISKAFKHATLATSHKAFEIIMGYAQDGANLAQEQINDLISAIELDWEGYTNLQEHLIDALADLPDEKSIKEIRETRTTALHYVEQNFFPNHGFDAPHHSLS